MEYSEKNQPTQTDESKEKMVRGSLWMSLGSVVSRLMGAIYVIPWYIWMGQNGELANGLFTKGYNIYSLFLMISTAGIPGAIAKQISHYNSKNEYGISHKLFKQAMIVMAGLGMVCFGIMLFGAPLLADGNPDLIPTMRALSLAVLVFPCMSVIRGFFQGYQNMMPAAISQMIEQFVRVFYMLLATFIIMKVQKGSYVDAVTQSTFAAFIGTLGAMATLLWFLKKYSPKLKALEAGSYNHETVSPGTLIKEIVMQAIPFIIVGSGITVVKIVDQFTFERIMHGFTNYTGKQLESLFALFSGNPDKLTMITISLATALSVTSLPLVTEAFTKKNQPGLARLLTDNLQLFFFVMIPATVGMIVVAEPLNTLFYKHDPLGTALLIEACLVGIILGFYSLVSTTLQGLYDNTRAIKFLAIGIVIKILLQYPCIRLFESFGPLLATGIAFSVAGFLTTRAIHRLTQFDVSLVARRTLLIFIFSILLAIVAVIVRQLCYLVLSPASKVQSFIIIMLVALAGGAVYVYLVLKVGLAEKLLGEKVIQLRDKLRIKPLR